MRKKKSKEKLTSFNSPMATPGRRMHRITKVLGIALLLTSFLVGLGAVTAPAEKTEFYIYTKSLPAGSKLTELDIKSISLTDSSDLVQYQVSEANLTGAELSRDVQSGELVAVTDLNSKFSTTQELTLSFDPNLLPISINKGDQLDLWIVPLDGAGNVLGPATLAASNLIVASSVSDAGSFNAELPITFYVNPSQIPDILDSISIGRSFVVRR